MSIRFRYSDPRGIDEPAAWTSLGSNIRFADVGLANAAEAGDTATSGIRIDDPGGIYDFKGFRAFEVAETSAASNNQIIGRFVIGDRTVTRDPARSAIVGADRIWDIDLYDYNWHLGKRILVDADSKRPEETAGDRIRWLLTQAAHINLNDYGHVTYPSHQVDAADYRGQRPNDVLADCSLEGGYNFWVDFNEAHGRPELFFMKPEDSSTTSGVYISNDSSEVDSVTVFAPLDARLVRSGSRLAFGVHLSYANGWVYVRNDVVGQQYAKVDQQSSRHNIKKAARARRIATKFLNDHDTETDRLAVKVRVPAANVNDLRHGWLVNVRFTHLPGYSGGWTLCFIARRVVAQADQDGYYVLDLDLIPVGAGASNIALVQSKTDYSNNTTGTQNVTMPNPITAGHLLVVMAAIRGTPYSPSITSSGGWTAFTKREVGYIGTHQGWWKIAAAGEPQTVSINLGPNYKIATVAEFSGPTGVIASAGHANTTKGSSYTSESISMGSSPAVAVCSIASCNKESNFHATTSLPANSGWTLLDRNNVGGPLSDLVPYVLTAYRIESAPSGTYSMTVDAAFDGGHAMPGIDPGGDLSTIASFA